jgi:hypothetical protein
LTIRDYLPVGEVDFNLFALQDSVRNIHNPGADDDGFRVLAER